MSALVAATLLSISPTPLDHVAAAADLAAEPGTPPLAGRAPRARLALLGAMVRLGALDAGAPDLRWFGAGLAWEAELDHARRLVARVRECPADDWLPGGAWLAAESAAYGATAAAWRARAAEYRSRAEWEGDRADALLAWARHFDAVGDGYAAEACRFAGWSGASWQRPRRVVLGEAREWMGAAAWSARRWPGE